MSLVPHASAIGFPAELPQVGKYGMPEYFTGNTLRFWSKVCLSMTIGWRPPRMGNPGSATDIS